MKEYNCSVYIDESGDDGLTVKSNPNFVLGGFLTLDSKRDNLKNNISSLESKIGTKIHCSHKSINHIKMVYLSKQLSIMPIKVFSVISQKKTLYNSYTPNNNQEYYNKNVQYLLEKIGQFIEEKEKLSKRIILTNIIFEERKNHDYKRMKNFIQKIKDNPIYFQSKTLRYINLDNISTKKKDEEDLLKIADIIAHSVYKVISPDIKYNITEHRYVEEFKNKFYENENKILDYGIKIVRQSKCDFSEEDITYIKNLKAND